MDFVPIKTEDGSISLYNFKVKDIYHSIIGAYTEALYKYILPSGLIEFAKNNNEIKILDICYGLGYNSKVATEEIFKINPNCKVTINAIEQDPKILAFSCILSDKINNEFIKNKFSKEIIKHIDAEQIIIEYLENLSKLLPDVSKYLPKVYNFVSEFDLKQKLHNIYYRTVSPRNSMHCKNNTVYDLLTLNIYNDDARNIIKLINTEHDFIFHDPFTPSKAPSLWTVNFFKELYRLLSEHGNLTTYSSAVSIRSGLIETGFHIGKTEPVGKKSSGTIAYKKKELIKNSMTDKELKLLETTAGIPYYDKNFSSDDNEIINNRILMQKKSNRLSSSKFMKNYN